MDLYCPTLRLVGHMTSLEGEEASHYLIKKGVLDSLVPFFHSCSTKIQKEVCWILSNIVLCQNPPITSYFVDLPIFEKVLVACSNGCLDLQREAKWCLFNLISLSDCITREKILKMHDFALVEILKSALHS